MSRNKPLWLGRGIKTATFQSLYLDICQHQLWFSLCLLVAAQLQLPTASAQQGRKSKTPKCWFQIPSKWAVISHYDWGEASKLQHFKCSVLKTCMCFIKLWYDIWQSKAPKWWFQILSKWAVINHSDWGEASKRHQNCNTPEVLFLKTCICLIKLQYDTPTPQNADSRFSLNEPW